MGFLNIGLGVFMMSAVLFKIDRPFSKRSRQFFKISMSLLNIRVAFCGVGGVLRVCFNLFRLR